MFGSIIQAILHQSYQYFISQWGEIEDSLVFYLNVWSGVGIINILASCLDSMIGSRHDGSILLHQSMGRNRRQPRFISQEQGPQ